MTTLIDEKRDVLDRLCQQYDVLSLALFGSAARDVPGSQPGDLDFLVTFAPMSPIEHADAYFGLLDELEQLFGLPIDLTEPDPIRNPYLLQEIELTKVVVYAAA